MINDRELTPVYAALQPKRRPFSPTSFKVCLEIIWNVFQEFNNNWIWCKERIHVIFLFAYFRSHPSSEIIRYYGIFRFIYHAYWFWLTSLWTLDVKWKREGDDGNTIGNFSITLCRHSEICTHLLASSSNYFKLHANCFVKEPLSVCLCLISDRSDVNMCRYE
jgi:hypothetical protein